MMQIASSRQLRAAFLRWALFLVPAILLLGFLSGRVSGSGPDNPWFAALVKPDIYPAPAVFGPAFFAIVWSALYVLMALALAQVLTAPGARGRWLAVSIFLLQLALNLAWSPLFFGAHRISGALALIGGIDALLLLTVVRTDLLAEWKNTLPADAPNYFLINIDPDSWSPQGATS